MTKKINYTYKQMVTLGNTRKNMELNGFKIKMFINLYMLRKNVSKLKKNKRLQKSYD